MGFKCCVPKCSSTNKRSHCFPNDFELFKQWCILIARLDFLNKDFKAVRRNYRLCDDHFDESCKFVNIRNRSDLKQGSLPSINLPVQIVEQTDTAVSRAAICEDLPGEVEEQPCLPSTSTSEPSTSDGRSASTSKPIIKLPRKKGNVVSRKRKILEGESKKINLLHKVGLHKKAQLTPRKAKLYELSKTYLSLAKELEQENVSNKEYLDQIVHLVETGEIFKQQVNLTTWHFVRSQLQQQFKHKRGRRFSLNDKLLGLLLLKQSPKGYRLLQKIFALPSRKTLMNLLKKVPFRPGINASIMNSLKNQVKQLDDMHRHCILLFDEISLHPSLSYNKSLDTIDGFENDGEEKKLKIADHAMVFMIKGVAKKWKQPLAYFFTANAMTKENVAKNVTRIIRSLKEIGLNVVATVCDQYNASAVNLLVQQTKATMAREKKTHEKFTFCVGEDEIIPLYDAPHLLKGVRNNMLKGDVHFQWKKGPQIAKWQHIISAYELDGSSGDVDFEDPNVSDFRILHKLTDEHVYPDKIKKMKVKHAAQVFSQRVSATIRAFAQGNKILPEEAVGTADFLLFMDRLFDSVNGSTIDAHLGKIFRCAVQNSSPHLEFWAEAKAVLKSITFRTEARTCIPPSIKNFIITIDGLMELWSKMQKVGFKFLITRNLNQDALENFFGSIRSHGVRNINPTCTSFTSSFKSLIINNFVSPHSAGRNCEEDESAGALDSLKHFIVSNADEDLEGISAMEDISEDNFQFRRTTNEQILQLDTYLTGYVCKKIFRWIGVCKKCREVLITPDDTADTLLITFRDYTGHSLLRPRAKFSTLFNLACQVAHFYVVKLATQSNVKQTLLTKLNAKINVNFPTCTKHNTIALFFKYFCNLFVFCYVKNINNIIEGKHCKNINDELKRKALQKHLKYRKQKFAMRKTKQLV